MKSVKEAICGGERYFCFSVRVYQDIMEKYESLDAMLTAMDTAGALEDVAWLASRMMIAGEKYAKRRGLDCPPALTPEDILDELGVDEIVKMKGIIFSTIASDSKSEVELATEENPTKAGE